MRHQPLQQGTQEHIALVMFTARVQEVADKAGVVVFFVGNAQCLKDVVALTGQPPPNLFCQHPIMHKRVLQQFACSAGFLCLWTFRKRVDFAQVVPHWMGLRTMANRLVGV